MNGSRCSSTFWASALLLAFFAMLGCQEDGPEPATGTATELLGEPSPQLEGAPLGRQPRGDIVQALRSELTVSRHESDGGGRAWLEVDGEDVGELKAVASGSRSWTLIYQAGPLGIEIGGAVFLQVSPFWGWSTPQGERPDRPGFTEVTTTAEGVSLAVRTVDQQLLAVLIQQRRLAAGEQLRIVYGAGVAAAKSDRYAESSERFWVAVDGDGDGIRGLLKDSPAVDIVAGPAAQLLAILPTTGRPGEPLSLHLSVLDAAGNAGTPFVGTIHLEAEPSLGVELEPVPFKAEHGGARIVELRPRESGVLRVQAIGPAGLRAESNPLQVAAEGRRILWADLQNHSNFSDGTALPEELYAYGRDIAGLDIMSVTDHDHWGLRFLDRSPDLWRHIQDTTERLHQPGRFVTVRGFEWTSWLHGHRHVLVFDDQPLPILSSIDEAMDHPQELWQALAGRRAFTVAHHSAGGPIAVDWSIAPDPLLEPVTEIVSVHGSSEAADSPKLIYRPVAGNFVRDALQRGYRLGFIGSSDGHDGHPGLGHLASGVSGLAAVMAEELTRDAVYEALSERRAYATSGVRILLRAVYGGYLMGAQVPLDEGKARRATSDQVSVPVVPADQLFVQVIAPSTLDRIDVVRGDESVATLGCEAERQCSFVLTIDDLAPGEFLYVRAVQSDGHFAVSSPFFFVDDDPVDS